jgi:hypothetical protein
MERVMLKTTLLLFYPSTISLYLFYSVNNHYLQKKKNKKID